MIVLLFCKSVLNRLPTILDCKGTIELSTTWMAEISSPYISALILVTTATIIGGVLFSSRCPLLHRNAKFWPVLAILSRIYALFGAGILYYSTSTSTRYFSLSQLLLGIKTLAFELATRSNKVNQQKHDQS